MVFACCRTAGLRDNDIEDAASETFLAAFQSIHRFHGNAKLSSWLWSIAYRKAVTIRRNKKSTQMLNKDWLNEIPMGEGTGSDSFFETKEQSDLIWGAVRRLPENWGAVVVLFYREDKSIPEIAEILAIPANTVKTYLDRSRKKLYELLEKVWENDYVKS